MKNHSLFINRITGLFFLLILITGCFFLGGFGLTKTSVELDVKKHRIYESADAGTLLGDAASDYEKTKQTYNGRDLVLTGQVSTKKGNNKEIGISGEGTDKKIICRTSDKDTMSVISSLKEGDRVRVYGELSFGMINKELTMDTDSVSRAEGDEKASKDEWYFIDGYKIDGKSSQERSLDGGRVTYRIPASWTASERNIKENRLGEIDGYHYVLNVKGKSDVRPDNVFVCYFSKDLLVDKEDINDPVQVEKKIITNILGGDADVNRFTMESRSTKNGSGEKYSYYKGRYEDSAILPSPYRVEMVFQPVKSEGIILYLYVYDDRDMQEDTNVRDIIYVMSRTKLH